MWLVFINGMSAAFCLTLATRAVIEGKPGRAVVWALAAFFVVLSTAWVVHA